MRGISSMALLLVLLSAGCSSPQPDASTTGVGTGDGAVPLVEDPGAEAEMVVLVNDTIDLTLTTTPNACAFSCVTGGAYSLYIHDRVAPLVGGTLEIAGTPQSPTEGSFIARVAVYADCDPGCTWVADLAEERGEGPIMIEVPDHTFEDGQVLGIRLSPTTTVEVVTVTAGWTFNVKGVLTFQAVA